MAVYLKPCTGCPLREGCEQRNDFRKRVSGLGLRSATFNCQRLKAALAPGTRIVVKHPIAVEVDSYYGDTEIFYEDLPATITSSHVDEFSCVIDRNALLQAIEDLEGEGADKVDTYRFRKTLKARRIIRFLDEPRRGFCSCGRVKSADGSCERRPTEECWDTRLLAEKERAA